MSAPKLRLLADENTHLELLAFLRSSGADVKRVPSGVSNGAVIRLCIKERRTLLTHDADFADASRFPPEKTRGIVLLRVHPQTVPALLAAGRILLTYSPKALQKKLIVLGRSLPP